MKKKNKKFLSLFLRYFLLILIGLFWINLIYNLLTPITSYAIYFLLKLFINAQINQNIIYLPHGIILELIPSCIAGAAYYFLLILHLSIPNIKIKKRIKMILLGFSLLFIINVIRIILLSFLLISNSGFFNIVHKIFWYFLSIVLIVFIWFFEVKVFKIKEIPFYTDLNFLYKNSLLKK